MNEQCRNNENNNINTKVFVPVTVDTKHKTSVIQCKLGFQTKKIMEKKIVTCA